ncbi:chromosome segregation protein [Ophiocordyceps sinensis CO18]|uniref:Chromosome segregation protein n=1 Tax=Ophiocordyceps sinensis (strain Co18 / CGMCC 3.14243) TaxID=911162 RepID=T5A7R1_OPHSC|nr:chromosome segregation protein [Ophiocordyceps sinensis CO18]
MAPRAIAASSLPNPRADIDDLSCFPLESQPLTTRKRARGRPPGASNKITKPVSKTTRESSKGAQAAVSTLARQLSAAQAQGSAPAGPLDYGNKPLHYGTTETRAGNGRTESCTAKSSSVRTRPSRNPNKLKAGEPAILERATNLADCSTIVEIPETQEVDLLRIDESQDGPAVFDELLAADLGMKLEDATARNSFENILVRRRFGDLTKRYGNLEMRYRDLREVGVKAAERNFNCLRKQAEENIAASNKLISQLKEDVAAQAELVEQGQDLKHRLERSEANGNSLQTEIDGLITSLSEARSEITTLSAKLAASRNSETGGAEITTLSAKLAASRNSETGAAVAQAKEDLYSDLTGLIVRGLRRGDEEDLFDCIQTGRNGTLHFKLALERGSRTDNYGDVQLTYRPQLDTDRDSDLMELLPDYLVEEIIFPRSHASKFYSRVIKSLSKRTDSCY